jgi:hypothetical protein
MADENITLTDDNGNNLYPVTLASNVSGLDTQLSNKASTQDIANVRTEIDNVKNASSVQKNTYANLAFPSYENKLSFNHNLRYKAPCDGYIYNVTHDSSTHRIRTWIIAKDGFEFYFQDYSYDGNAYNAHCLFVPISKGDVFYTDNRSDYRYFIPCIGAVKSGEWQGFVPVP